MKLKQVIEELEKAQSHFKYDRKCLFGFSNPHSWRGSYQDLAFEPATDIAISAMIAYCKDAIGSTYTGWKGGEYTMNLDSDCHIAMQGNTGIELSIDSFRFMIYGNEFRSDDEVYQQQKLNIENLQHDLRTANKIITCMKEIQINFADLKWQLDRYHG